MAITHYLFSAFHPNAFSIHPLSCSCIEVSEVWISSYHFSAKTSSVTFHCLGSSGPLPASPYPFYHYMLGSPLPGDPLSQNEQALNLRKVAQLILHVSMQTVPLQTHKPKDFYTGFPFLFWSGCPGSHQLQSNSFHLLILVYVWLPLCIYFIFPWTSTKCVCLSQATIEQVSNSA